MQFLFCTLCQGAFNLLMHFDSQIFLNFFDILMDTLGTDVVYHNDDLLFSVSDDTLPCGSKSEFWMY